MSINQKFDQWFNEKFPENKFLGHGEALRQSFRNDIAFPAFIMGLTEGYDAVFDSEKRSKIQDFLKDL